MPLWPIRAEQFVQSSNLIGTRELNFLFVASPDQCEVRDHQQEDLQRRGLHHDHRQGRPPGPLVCQGDIRPGHSPGPN